MLAAVGLVLVWGSVASQRATIAEDGFENFKSFEAPQIHPLVLTPGGSRLLAVNTPAASLSVFRTGSGMPALEKEIPVGLEPVSVAARDEREAWITNWLSRSVSIVDIDSGNVVRTLEVGEGPTDIVFAGVQNELAFVCVSGLRQVKIYQLGNLDAPPQVIEIRGKQPRSLLRDSSGARVFVSVFESGNETTVVPGDRVTAAGGPPKAVPKKAKRLPSPPETGLIVKWNGSQWVDDRGNGRWTAAIPYRLADVDLAVINASGGAPAVVSELRGLGTHIGNAVIDTSAERLYVVNTDSLNQIRFEQNLSGRFAKTRLATIDLAPAIHVESNLDLNPHVDLNDPAGTASERRKSLALPADISRGADGRIYIAATGSAKVGVFDGDGNVISRFAVGRGPTGLALEQSNARLYVLNRFDQTISTVDLAAGSETGRVQIGFNPEPAEIMRGRLFLYDAGLSAHGDLSCASCHRNGDRDGLAWDLGNPKGNLEIVNGGLLPSVFHPMKGPMTTQSLRGIIGTEPFHWRGDRRELSDFNPAFVSLLGGERELTSDEMADFESFIRSLTYPPNPNQNLDRTYPAPPGGPSAARGETLFNNSLLDGGLVTCNQCHTASGFKSGTNGLIIPGALLRESQDFKIPQLRGLYQKVGMRAEPGNQIAGFGFIHDGSIDTLLDFLRLPVFTFRNDNDRRDVEAFLLAFDTGLAPAVGLQATVDRSAAFAEERIALLISQAERGNCDLIVRGLIAGVARGFTYSGGGMFRPDRQAEPQVSLRDLLQNAGQASELTFTGVPSGAGRRLGIDRNNNGTLDGDER